MKKYTMPTICVTTFDSDVAVLASVFGAFASEWLNVFDKDWTGGEL
jgi:hypothetical protein